MKVEDPSIEAFRIIPDSNLKEREENKDLVTQATHVTAKEIGDSLHSPRKPKIDSEKPATGNPCRRHLSLWFTNIDTMTMEKRTELKFT